MKIYCRHPFKTNEKVTIPPGFGCHPGHPGSKDLVFPGITFGTPVYAMESGVIADVRTNRPHCPTPDCPQYANNVVIRGQDGFFTEYNHMTRATKVDLRVDPRVGPGGRPWRWNRQLLKIGDSITRGQLIGFVDDSGYTTGPHLHVGRYTPGDDKTWWSRPTCDWMIQGVDSFLQFPPLDCRPMPRRVVHGYYIRNSPFYM
ncbi:M23 family metallopeptidase [Brevibacillus laterosporus]|uniref:M23 family metallopeptidase n=1 Tax=Brevibacillus laterosporus TaxID=1465 RepID=UPI001443DB8E|nr:M23 family metallopeptidase [Brevibacillus laterosporus]NKQ20716.1 M23 family metallopeptidase [Brevibacillus laterosporus]WNX29675.1 M23 family metallopeptidase [Brevibacillus laterosporus]